MTRVGLVGGLGPESTIDYYRRILAVWQVASPGSSPSILIDSLDVDLGIRLVSEDRAALTAYLLESLERLHRAGATFAAMAANTPHVVFDDLASRSPLPLLSIVETCADEAARRGVRRAGVLGTRFTMASPMYADVFARRGIEVVAPDDDEREWLHARYIGELLRGDFRDETRAGVIALVERLRERHAIDAIVFAGTELPLLLRSDTVAELPTLDTTELHVRAIVDRLR